jgi:EAL domain-containing protein (putative c-di-GMP-specific phosphodiesterase class I)/GGDEF domain-containing protein
MSLVNQLIGAVFAVLIGLVSGTLYIMSDSSKAMLVSQLESHGQDAATHLGLYAAPYIADKDTVLIETTVQALFDNGYYQSIKITDGEGNTLYQTNTPPHISGKAPDWFIDFFKLTPPAMHQEVSYQWRKVGNVEVQSRADYAYEKLWSGTADTLILFVTLSLVCAMLLSGLIRWIIRPLKGIEAQANALENRQYLELEEIPKTRELKSVVLAMNSMVKRVKKMFDEQSNLIENLRQTAYQDPLTGLPNQRSTLSSLNSWFDQHKEFGPGSLLYLSIRDLQGLNTKLGEEQTNNAIKTIAKHLQDFSQQFEPSIVGRLSGADFICVFPLIEEEPIKRHIAEFLLGLDTQLGKAFNLSAESPVQYVSITCFEETDSADHVLSDAKRACAEARAQNQALLLPDRFSGSNIASQNWQHHVAQSIYQESIVLQYLPTVASNQKDEVQKELLARIYDQEGQLCPAGAFIPVVKSLNLIHALDKLVLSKTLEVLSQSNHERLTVNLTQQTLHTEGFIEWLDEKLKSTQPGRRLNIEINETAILNDVVQVIRFRQFLKEHNVGFGVDNFGIHPSGFSYLYSVQPDYIKMDGSLIREIEEHPADGFLVRSLVSAAHSLEIQVYAERVERPSQTQALIDLGLDGFQGFLFGQPKTL